MPEKKMKDLFPTESLLGMGPFWPQIKNYEFNLGANLKGAGQRIH